MTTASPPSGKMSPLSIAQPGLDGFVGRDGEASNLLAVTATERETAGLRTGQKICNRQPYFPTNHEDHGIELKIMTS